MAQTPARKAKAQLPPFVERESLQQMYCSLRPYLTVMYMDSRHPSISDDRICVRSQLAMYAYRYAWTIIRQDA